MNYDKDWYENLNKPPFQPPAKVFGPVWTVLYIMMFIAFGIVAANDFELESFFAYLFFFAQLWVNFSWSKIFFREHNLRKAFLVCALLTLLVFCTMIIFFTVSFWSGLLFVPYFCWCVFATILCFEILERNE